MPNYRSFCILCILALPIISYGQKIPRQSISGKLLPASKNLHLESIYIYNKLTSEGILSDSLGNFKLDLRLGDTIAVSAMQIESTEIVVKEMHLKDAFITLAIQANMEYLEEVRINNRNLTGNLGLDMKRIGIEPIVTSADLGFPSLGPDMTKGERLLSSYTPYSLKSFNRLDVEWLYAVLSGDLKRIKHRVSLEKLEEKRLSIINRMPNSFYTNKLKVSLENIPHFIEFCESQKDLNNLINMPIIEFIETLEETIVLYKVSFPERF